MTAPLYQLAGAYQQLLELAEAGEDVTDALAKLDGELQHKALNICRVLSQLDNDAAILGEEATRLLGRRKAAVRGAERLRDYIKASMKAANITKIKSPLFTLTLSPGQPKVLIIDLAQVPPELTRVVPESREADKPAILKLHKETGEVPPGTDIQETHKLTVR